MSRTRRIRSCPLAAIERELVERIGSHPQIVSEGVRDENTLYFSVRLAEAVPYFGTCVWKPVSSNCLVGLRYPGVVRGFNMPLETVPQFVEGLNAVMGEKAKLRAGAFVWERSEIHYRLLLPHHNNQNAASVVRTLLLCAQTFDEAMRLFKLIAAIGRIPLPEEMRLFFSDTSGPLQ